MTDKTFSELVKERIALMKDHKITVRGEEGFGMSSHMLYLDGWIISQMAIEGEKIIEELK